MPEFGEIDLSQPEWDLNRLAAELLGVGWLIGDRDQERVEVVGQEINREQLAVRGIKTLIEQAEHLSHTADSDWSNIPQLRSAAHTLYEQFVAKK